MYLPKGDGARRVVYPADNVFQFRSCVQRSLRTLRLSRSCACIALLDDPSAIGLTGPLLLNTDQRLPEAIFMQQQSSAASTQVAEPDLETSHECAKPDLRPGRGLHRRYSHALRVGQHRRALITEPC